MEINVQYKVDPDDLKNAIVIDPIRIRFINTENISFLGKTGLMMADAGYHFFVERAMGVDLIKAGIARVAPEALKNGN